MAGRSTARKAALISGRNTTALCQDPPDCTIGTATNRANSFASFLLGLPDQASKSVQFPDEYSIRAMLYSLYIRDRWNVTPRLTLNYGVRWEYFPYPTRTDRGLERYDPTINKVLICGVGSVPDDCGTEYQQKAILAAYRHFLAAAEHFGCPGGLRTHERSI